ncbi:hypothetical protein KGM48_03965 [Patescibacteria group bacterium]|nr:hypothetical protein [Patescibacteria group bacterium]
MIPFLSGFIGNEAGSALLLSLAVILCAFFLEDITTVIVGILAAEGYIGIPLALFSLYAGIILGDTILYSIGALARTHPKLAHYIDHGYTASFRSWLEGRYAVIIFSGHFIPGLRFTTYVASGFFRRPLSAFIPTAIASGLALGTLLFSVSYWFGSLTAAWIRPFRWLIAATFLLILFLASRQHLRAYRLKRNGPG